MSDDRSWSWSRRQSHTIFCVPRRRTDGQTMCCIKSACFFIIRNARALCPPARCFVAAEPGKTNSFFYYIQRYPGPTPIGPSRRLRIRDITARTVLQGFLTNCRLDSKIQRSYHASHGGENAKQTRHTACAGREEVEEDQFRLQWLSSKK